MQLDLCLRSLKKHFKEYTAQAHVVVIYTSSTDDFEKGYDVLRKDHHDVKFVKQGTFRTDTLKEINEHAEHNPYTMFLVDDVVFKDNFSLNDTIFRECLYGNEHMLAVSLRLHRNASYCYAINNNMRLPQLTRNVPGEFLVWKYRGCDGDWGYGLSLDGNVYNTKFILWLLNKLDFHNPNSMEAALNHPNVNSGIRPQFLCCYDGKSKLLNNPANRVQDAFPNRCENSYGAEELNEMYLKGKRISLENITGIDNFSVHYPIDYEFLQV